MVRAVRAERRTTLARMSTCPSCGTANPDGARFCVSCGSSLAPACRRCGAELPDGARFCPACGTPVEETQVQAATAERKVVTILFADVTGSTSIGERLDPERLRDVMQTYFAAMRGEIEAQGGTVEKFIGDAVMAAFGVPTSHEDDATRALRAALAMLARLDAVNAELARHHDVTLRIRVGVNTGEVLATGETTPGEPMVTGDAVNVAARLEAAAAPGEVLASERTVRAARGFRVEDVGALELKGKAERIHAFRVLDETVVLPERGVPGLHAPLVGRDDEIEVLSSLFARVERERRPHLVTLYGDAGVGKSRLTREFVAALGERAALVRGRCPPYGEGVTFWPLAEMLKAHAGVLDTDPSDVALERVRKAGRELVTSEVSTDPDRTAAVLAFTVGIEDPAFSSERMEAKDVRAEVHAAWRSFFSALALAHPVVVLIEDIHWADPELLDLLEDLADRAVGPLLFVCPSRPELTARRPDWGGGRRNHTAIALDPLTFEESDRLVGFLLAVDDLPAPVRSRILSRAEGNPFFLEEIVRHLIDERMLLREDGRWRAASGIDDVEIPDTVQAVLAARIDLLEPEHKRVLQAAAVVGRVFWPGPLRDLAGGADVPAALATLETRDLVTSRLGSSIAGEPEFAFKHILTRDVAYESLPRRERPAAHASVAGWIERTAGARARELVELLAYHYATAVAASEGDGGEDLRRKAFEALVAASGEARRKQVLKKAERFAEEALGVARGDAERAVALEALGEAFFDSYQGDLGWRYFREAALVRASVAGEARDPRVAYLCARAAETPTRWPGSMRQVPGPEDVEPLLELGMAHVPEGDSEERARLQAIGASWPFAFPGLDVTPEEGLAYERQGIEAADMALRLGRPDIASGALDAAAGYSIARGLYQRTLEIEERRFRLAPDLAEFEVGDLYAMLAWSNYELGRYDAALRLADEGLELMAGRQANVEIHVRAWRAALRYRLADWDGCIAAYEEVRSLLEDRRDDPPYFATHAFAAAAIVHHRRGDAVERDRLVNVLLPLGAGFSSRLFGWLLVVLLERGDLATARELREHLPAAWRVHAMSIYEARCELVAAAGAWDEAPPLVAEARAYAEASGSTPTAALADRLEGRAAAAAGDADRASSSLSRAIERFRALGSTYDAADTAIDLAGVMIEAGRRAEADRVLSNARGTLERLRAVTALDRLREVADAAG
jgi:class 3 adenylate cyclase/tetratricopeptide (TPR) repeat protein